MDPYHCHRNWWTTCRAKHKEVALDRISGEESPSDLTIKEILSQLDAVSTQSSSLYVEQFTCEELTSILGIPVGLSRAKPILWPGQAAQLVKGVERLREDYDHELALAYIQDRLTQEEKQEVFHPMEDPGFRELMQLELRLAKCYTAVKASPPQTVAARVYFNVTASKSGRYHRSHKGNPRPYL